MCGVGVLQGSSKNAGEGLENVEDKDYPNTGRKNGGGIRFTPIEMQLSQQELLVSNLQMR